MTYNWSTLPFQALYNALSSKNDELIQSLTEELSDDLISLLIVKQKSETSRKSLESGNVTLSDGSSFQVNQTFIENVINLSDLLNIDELIAAEIFYYATQNELKNLGTSYLDSAIAAYYSRRDYILQIVSYYLCFSNSINISKSNQNENLTSSSSTEISIFNDSSNQNNGKTYLKDKIFQIKNFSITHILESFKAIEKELELIKQSVERSKVLGTYHEHAPFMKNIRFRRNQLFKQFQIVGEILLGYIYSGFKSNHFTLDNFTSILNHITSFDPTDNFSLCYIPGLFTYVSNLDKINDNDVENLQKLVIDSVNNIDKLAECPIKALILLVFTTNFIDWCKKSKDRKNKFDFTFSVDDPMQKFVSAGALEQLLSICADISLIESTLDHSIKPFYDFRSFLQQHIPKSLPIRLFDIDEEATSRAKHSLQRQKLLGSESIETDAVTIYKIDDQITFNEHFVDFLVPILSTFIHSFISNAAFFMSQLRDTEEDLLLSSEDFNLEELTENADLERFYMSIYYLYSERPQYATEIWSDTSSSLYGFLQWASRCNSPLIMSTFAMVLASLATGESNSINVFTFLQMTNSSNPNVLTNPRENSTLLTKYSSISWSTIYSTLSYYNDALSKVLENSVLGNLVDSNNSSNKKIVTELGEDSIIYISGFFQVISQVSKNSTKAKVELLDSDNNQLFTILINLLNSNTSLNGSIMALLTSLLGDSEQERFKFWQAIDNCFFYNNKNNSFINFTNENFSKKLADYHSIFGFVDLITKLLTPLDSSTNISQSLKHSFPQELGSMVRRPGVWCYINYICGKVFPEVDYLDASDNEKTLLKFSILKLMNICLNQLDPDIVLNAAACRIKNIDFVTANNNIITYLQSHQGSAVLNVLYDNKVYDSLFNISNLGIDRLSELSEISIVTKTLEESLKLIDNALLFESFFTDELIPILRLPDNNYVDPTTVALSGLHRFSESFILNLPVVANFSLYVGSTQLQVAEKSLSILKKLSTSKEFNNLQIGVHLNLIKKNKLLVLCETIDETIRIRSQFINQIENPNYSQEYLSLKFAILNFLNLNLSIDDKQPTIAHFLLGFDTKKINFGSPDVETTIASNKSLFRSIVNILKTTLVSINDVSNFTYTFVKVCSLCLEIIVKLCKSDMTGRKILQYVRTDGSELSPLNSNNNLILFLLENTKKLPVNSLFSGMKFDGTFKVENKFCSEGEAISTFNNFIFYRHNLLELIAVEIHVSSINGTLSLKRAYLETLTHLSSFVSASSKVLNYLDILNFKAYNMIEPIDNTFASFDYEYIFKRIKSIDVTTETNNSHYDLSIIDKLVALYAKSSKKSFDVKENERIIAMESAKLKKIIICSASYDTFKFNMYKYLSSWTLLVRVLVAELDMKISVRSDFIVEVFQCITPKLDEYMDYDVTFAELLSSLCVHLLSVYSADKNILYTNKSEIEARSLFDYNRLFPLFKVAMQRIILPFSTSNLRSDLYIIGSNIVENISHNTRNITDLVVFLKSLDSKTFDVICHDTLVGDGSSRITSLLLLENIIKLTDSFNGSNFQENLLFETLFKGNYFSLLIQKFKVVDASFCRALNPNTGNSGITFYELTYELTYFKSIISLLTRIAQIRYGAQMLIRNDIFKTIQECKFLQLDADLGFELKLQEYLNGSSAFVTMKISLDNPLKINDNDTAQEIISYYEILIPVFQLINSIIISSGSQNSVCNLQAETIKVHFSNLIAGVLKREVVYEELKNEVGNYNVEGLKELTKMFILFHSLVE